MKRLVCCVAVLALLVACGQRGDLYFPDAGREAVITVPAQLPEALQSASEEDSDEAAAPAQPGAGNAPADAGQ
jgi:predicted small lipoprotein YifL